VSAKQRVARIYGNAYCVRNSDQWRVFSSLNYPHQLGIGNSAASAWKNAEKSIFTRKADTMTPPSPVAALIYEY
jgi:hypothetical protein